AEEWFRQEPWFQQRLIKDTAQAAALAKTFGEQFPPVYKRIMEEALRLGTKPIDDTSPLQHYPDLESFTQSVTARALRYNRPTPEAEWLNLHNTCVAAVNDWDKNHNPFAFQKVLDEKIADSKNSYGGMLEQGTFEVPKRTTLIPHTVLAMEQLDIDGVSYEVQVQDNGKRFVAATFDLNDIP